jgi:hypothetical protein
MDPSVYDMMKALQAAKAAQASVEKVTISVKREPGSDTPLSGKKRKLSEDATNRGLSRAEPNTRLGHGHDACSPAPPPGFSAQKTSRSSSIRDHDPKAPHMPEGDTDDDWETARETLQSIVAPPRSSSAKPSDVVRSSYVTMLQVRT